MIHKKILTLGICCSLLIFSSCNNDGATSAEKETKGSNLKATDAPEESGEGGYQKNPNLAPNFFIFGNIKNGNNASLVVEANSNKGAILITRAFTNADGDFEISGNIEDMGLYQLRLEERLKEGQEPKVIPLTLVPNDSVNIQIEFDNFNQSPVFSGTLWSEHLNNYMRQLNDFVQWRDKNINPQTESQEQIMDKIMREKKKMDDMTIAAVKKDPSNPAHLLLMTNLMPMMGFEYWDASNLNYLIMIRDAYKKTYPDNAMTKMIAEQIDQVKSGHENFVQFNVEKSAPEIALRDPDGRTRKLSDLKGKYVLIDFWASWCNPCRMENPNVVRLYKQYQNKNFDIFSVSLDNDKNRWVKAIAADGLIWKNHVSDLKGWESAVVPLYGVKGIPHTVLIDPKGKIIETNLRGAKLEQKLKELFD